MFSAFARSAPRHAARAVSPGLPARLAARLAIVMTCGLGTLVPTAMAAPAPAATSPATAITAVTSAPGADRGIALYVPTAVRTLARGASANAAPPKPVPLVVVLHGSGGRGADLVQAWQSLAEENGVIVVGPDATSTAGWTLADDGPQVLCELVEVLKERYPIDPQRVYLFGYSGGALFALTVGLMESEYFAGVAAYGGAWRTPAEQGVVRLARRPLPVKLLLGSADPIFSLDVARGTLGVLREAQSPAELTVFEGADHGYAERSPRINAAAWDYLSRQALGKSPAYVDYPIPRPQPDAVRPDETQHFTLPAAPRPDLPPSAPR